MLKGPPTPSQELQPLPLVKWNLELKWNHEPKWNHELKWTQSWGLQKENLKVSNSKSLGILQPGQPVIGDLWKCWPGAASGLKLSNWLVLKWGCSQSSKLKRRRTSESSKLTKENSQSNKLNEGENYKCQTRFWKKAHLQDLWPASVLQDFQVLLLLWNGLLLSNTGLVMAERISETMDWGLKPLNKYNFKHITISMEPLGMKNCNTN